MRLPILHLRLYQDNYEYSQGLFDDIEELLKKSLLAKLSKKDIMDKMNNFFGYSVVEKLKFTSFDYEKKILPKETIKEKNVINNRYKKKINDVKNEKIKKSLLELTKVFKEK